MDVVLNPGDAPVANAGGNRTVYANDRVFLDGGGSEDPDGTITSYSWEQTGGSGVSLENGGTEVAQFDAPPVDEDAELRFRLTVTDEDGLTDSDTLTVTVRETPSSPPTATILTENTAIAAGAEVNLAGVATDPEGEITDIYWTQISGIGGSLGTPTTDGSQSFITFTTPTVTEAETVVVRMTAIDGDNDFDTDDLFIQVYPPADGPPPNIPPTARTTENQRVTAGELVYLADLGSGDADGRVVGYRWEQVGGPEVELLGAETTLGSFMAPDVTENQLLTFRLIVTDDDDATDSRQLRVVVTPAT
jgi:hypothetical protein